MQIVIDIPEELISEIDDENYQSTISWYDTALYCAIKDGTTLPKGHGRIGDLDAVYKDICNGIEAMTDVGMPADGQYVWGNCGAKMESREKE